MADLDVLRRAIAILEEKKARGLVVIDLSEVSIPTEHFVVVGTDNPVHAKALVNALRVGLPVKPLHSEGLEERRWIVLDYGEFVVHILEGEAREFYDIESLWADYTIDPEELQN
ncbi:MAG TPA: ribosome silencing factor [Candidatus Acetothermia bacterium]|nr:ribosome silencing factor [Candidatus Acetothermia bacterium]